jgi:hypothetical protein
MNDSNFNNSKYHRNKLSPLKLSALHKKNYSSDTKKEELIHGNNSVMVQKSMRNLTSFNESTSFDSKNLHILRKPYKIFLPIRTKIRNIKNSREFFVNNYYKGTLRKAYLMKDKSIIDSFNAKVNSSKTFDNIPKTNNNVFKVSFNSSNLSNVFQNNISKKSVVLSTESANTTKEMTNYNISTVSKNNLNNNDYNKYKIFSYQNNEKRNNSNFKKNNLSYDATNDFKAVRFINMNQGYKNLKYFNYFANNFSNQVKSILKEKYMNICLKERETRIQEYKEINNEKIKIDMKSKFNVNGLFNKFYRDYNIYCHRLKEKANESNRIDLLKWEIISHKNDINRLNIKKEKLLAKINKYEKMKKFLIWLKNYSFDIKNENWMYNPFYINRSSKNVKDLIKNHRKIKDPDDDEQQYNFSRRGSKIQLKRKKPNDMILTEENESEKSQKRKFRRFSVGERNPLLGSGINDIVAILNNHIANLLIYQNKLSIDLEPLKEEFEETFNSLKESDEKKNQILKMQYIILPEKKRIAKERNEFLTNTLWNINNDIFYSCKYGKMNVIIRDKLYKIYETLLNNNIINARLDETNKRKIKNVNDKIIFYLKNIEKGVNILIGSENIMKKQYPQLYDDIINEIYFAIKTKTFESQKKKELSKGKKNEEEVLNMMTKSFILNRKKDFYNYQYKKSHKKKKVEKIDPYEELRYSDKDDN